jgi:hypothetical protein
MVAFPPGTKVAYAPASARRSGLPKKYVLPRKAADRVVSIANKIKPRPAPTRLVASTCAPVGSFYFGDSFVNLLREGIIADAALQPAGDPVLPRLVEIQKANNWKWDDSVFQAMVDALEKSSEKQIESQPE